MIRGTHTALRKSARRAAVSQASSHGGQARGARGLTLPAASTVIAPSSRWDRRQIGSVPSAASETAFSILQALEDRSGDGQDAEGDAAPGRVLSSASGLARVGFPGAVALGQAVEIGESVSVVFRYDKRGTVVAALRGDVPREGDVAVPRRGLSVRAPTPLPGRVTYSSVCDLFQTAQDAHSVLQLPSMPPPPRRRPVTRRLPSGLAVSEALLPFGEGHRIGLVGPPSTGKSTAAKMLMESQDADTAIVYAAQKPEDVLKRQLGEGLPGGASAVVLHADAAKDTPGARYLLPLCAMQVAAELRKTHRHVLLILDDVVAFAGAAAELGSVPIGAPQVVAAALDSAGCVEFESGASALTVATVFDLEPEAEEELPRFLRDLWRSADPSMDVRLFFDLRMAADGIMPAIKVDELLACGAAPLYQAPVLQLLRVQLLQKLMTSRDLIYRLDMGKELGLHTEPQDQEELDSALVSRALLSHTQRCSLPELTVVLVASLVYYFPVRAPGRLPNKTAILHFKEGVVNLIRQDYPQLWETLTLMESLPQDQAGDAIRAVGRVLLQHRFDFHLTTPVF